MATESVAIESNWDRREPCPHERLTCKINGLQAIATLANTCVDEDARITDKVWSPLWYFIAEMCDEMKIDAAEIWAERRRPGFGNTTASESQVRQ